MIKKFIVEVDMSSKFDASFLRIALIGMMIKVVDIKDFPQQSTEEAEHPYDRAKRYYNEMLAGTKTLWECLGEIIKEKKENRLIERTAQCIAHRACCGSEHNPAEGKLHGHCVVCGVPFPCEYVGDKPSH